MGVGRVLLGFGRVGVQQGAVAQLVATDGEGELVGRSCGLRGGGVQKAQARGARPKLGATNGVETGQGACTAQCSQIKGNVPYLHALLCHTRAGPHFHTCVTAGVFSMDGDIAPLGDIVRLARKYGAYTFVGEV